MKIYFAASIRGGRDDVELYQKIIEYLKKYGEVLTEHVGDKKLAIAGEGGLTDRQIHARDDNWLMKSDILISEVSTPSIGIGYEIRGAVDNKKPILCLYRPQEGKKLSAMINGSPAIKVVEYKNFDEIRAAIDAFFSSLEFRVAL
ncbi:MAG: nucleoside 2-deoxyribosyltransferase [Patescibacteria group bacterium]|nr:nucleoside 2-deoxyribosyltransferase [Patescibacteria group bacterium]